ncbi:MAG TPA: hypothetical protein VJ903_03645, partial [Clostridia bacterium]|nr:hypothetical protein [Clostridia bacterium]
MAKYIKISLITILALAVMLALVFYGLNSENENADAATVYNYSQSTFNINSQEDFAIFMTTFSQTTNNFSNKTIYLNCDVDLSGYDTFLPRFYGTFYGNSHAISNAKSLIFGNDIGTTGKVYDLIIKKFNSSISEASLAIDNYGIIQNVKVTGSLYYHAIGGLFYNNYGTILDCVNAADLNVSSRIESNGVGGIVFNNYGTIGNSHFIGNITANNTIKALGGIVAYNKSVATIAESSANAEIYINTSGDSSYDTVLPTNCGTLIGNNEGQINNSYFIGYYTSYLTLPVTIIGDDSLNTNPNPYQNIYMMSQQDILVYDSATTAFIEPIGNISDYIDYVSSNGVYANELNSYPLLKLFDGQGTSGNPFLVNDVFDLFNLRGLYNTVGVNYTVAFSEDIDCRDYDIEIALNGFTYSSTIDGQGFCVKNFTQNALFAQNQADIVFNLGFYNSPSVAISGTLFNETSQYAYGFSQGTNSILATEPIQGDGTELEPYVVTTIEELKFIENSDAYFVLGNSIVVNSATKGVNTYLAIDEFYGELDGGGYCIVGLFEPLVQNNEGTMKNLVLKGYAPSGTTSLACYENNGYIDSIITYSSIASDNTSYASIAFTNNDTINKAHVIGNDATLTTTVAGITFTNNGILQNCFVEMENSAVFASDNTLGTINTSIGNDGTFIAINNNQIVNTEYFALIESGFDLVATFGYEINTNNPYPTLMQKSVRYKTSSDFLYDKTRTFVYTYSPTKSYNKAQFENLIVESTLNMTTSWTYNSEAFGLATFSDAGIYTFTIVYGGDNLYLPSKFTQTVTINKQTQAITPAFDVGAFDNINTTYLATNIEISEPIPNNLTSFGYVYSYTLKQGVNVVESIINVGAYTQEIKGISVNYSTVITTRTIVINKAPITIEVGDYNISYLENANLTNVTINAIGLLQGDALKPLDLLITEGTTPSFSTDYVQGDDVGDYYIEYNVELDNYVVTDILRGTLSVDKINLEQGNMNFYDKQVTYTGAEIEISVANILEGVSVLYDDNSYKDVGIYPVTATVVKANYNDLVLNATLTISKAQLDFNVDAITLDYDAERLQVSDESVTYTLTGLVGDDNSDIVNTLNISYDITQNGDDVTAFDVGIYDIHIDITGTLDNYTINGTSGSLEIKPIYLTSIYPTHDNYNTTYSGEIKTHPITYFDSYSVDVTYEYYYGETKVNNCIDAGTYQALATVAKINENYLDTVYTFTISIAKADINIYFENDTYTVVYDKTNKASSLIYPYSGELPQGQSAMFIVKKQDVIVDNAINAGEYTICYEVAESANYNEKIITALLIVEAKDILIEIQPSYTYTSNNIIPLVIGIEGEAEGDVSESDFTFTYYNSEMALLTRITRVGSYIVEATVTNPNYYLPTIYYNIVVNKLEVIIDLKYLEYSYGFRGEMSYGGVNYNIYSGGIIVRRGYLIPSTQVTVDISYPIARDDAGTYTVQTLNSGENYTFTISENSQLNNNNKVKINPVTLSVAWKFGITDIIGFNKNLTYAGIDQFGYFSYNIEGLVNNHNQTDFDFVLNELSEKQLIDAGSYQLAVFLLNESNYIMDNSILQVTIEKAQLNVKMIDVTVDYGEPLTRRSYQLFDTVGNDSSINDIHNLKGANVEIVCAYTQQSHVGSKFDYYFTGTFTNYVLNITSVGIVKVVENTKVTFTFHDKLFVYDGTYKSLRVAQSDEVINAADVELKYSENNYQKDVGTYAITLEVRYNVDSSVKTYTRNLTIVKAYPRLVMEQNVKTVFREDYTLWPKHILGKAYVGDNEVAGNFVFLESYKLEKGSNEYAVRFIPEDADNINVTTFDGYTIDAVVLNANAFEYNDLSKITYTEKGVEITGNVTMTLKRDIIEGLTLYQNDTQVDFIELNKSGIIKVSINYDGETVYENELQVEFIEETENVEIVVDASYLKLVSGITLNNKTMTVGSLGGRIALSDEHIGKYVLFINGNRITSDYPINGNERKIVVVIKDAKTSIVLFAEEFEIKASEQIAPEPNNPKDYTVLIIAGSVLGGTG